MLLCKVVVAVIAFALAFDFAYYVQDVHAAPVIWHFVRRIQMTMKMTCQRCQHWKKIFLEHMVVDIAAAAVAVVVVVVVAYK